MDSLYYLDETRKMRQKEIENEIEAGRIYNLVKESQSYKPGITERYFKYIKMFLGEIVGRLKCVFAQVTAVYHRKSNTGVNPR